MAKRVLPACPCGDQHIDQVCAGCAFRNHPGHDRPRHRGFVRVVDPTGALALCTLCAGSALVAAGEWGRFDVTVLLGVPAIELAG